MFGYSFYKKKLIFTRARLNKILKKKFIKINYSYIYENNIFIAFTFFKSGYFFFFKTFLLNYIGIIRTGFYFSTYFLFYFFSFFSIFYLKHISGLLYNIFLGFLNIQLKINLIESYKTNKIKYSKSFGSYSIINMIKTTLNYYLILLPSKKYKLFFILTRVYIYNYDGNINFFKLINQRFGFYYKNTRKSIVRGIAMNPVDHPHGGRTNSILKRKTP